MLHVRPVGPGVARYYLHQGPGVWAGSGVADLELGGPVAGGDLRAVLAGRDPSSRRFLPEVRRARRRAGWDLVFSAPKSLSLLAGSRMPGSGSWTAGAVSLAHGDAVAGALAHFEKRLLHISRSAAPDGFVASRGAIAARFDHESNAGGEPHVHSHLILMNLALDDSGRWSSVGPWWLGRREIDAVYVLGLRHHLQERGVDVDWRIRPDGLSDVAGVPRAALGAASTRGREASNGGRFTGRARDTPRPWRDSVLRAAGWDPATAMAPYSGGARRTRPTADEGLASAVTARLATRASTFGTRDVMVALAGLPQAQFSAEEALRWCDDFTSRCTPVRDGRRPLWTSKVAESSDRRLEAMVRERLGAPVGTPDAARPAMPPLVSRAVAGDPVVVLAADRHRSAFLAHAALAARCAGEWEAAGMKVRVAAPRPLDAMRWATLTGIEAHRPSTRTDVLIVDQADRRTSAELAVLLGSAPGAKVVLVEGGTSLRLAEPASRAIEGIRRSVPVLQVGETPAWEVGAADQPEPAKRLLERWAAGGLAAGGEHAILVGLGLPETLALNDAARRHLASLGRLTGEELLVGGRRFRSGDTVITVRPAGPGLPAGTLGTVETVDPSSATATIRWPSFVAEADRGVLARIGHGYAATPRLASRTSSPALVLGPAEGIGLDRGRVVEAFVARRLDGHMMARDMMARDAVARDAVARDQVVAYGPDT